MKAMVLHAAGQPFVAEDRPDPKPGPGEAVAKVLACGSGLTIHHLRAGRGTANFPIVIGHEITGEIVEVGRTDGIATDLAVGDPVTVYFYLIEGEDKWTRAGRAPISTRNRGYVGRQIDGGYAEYIKLPTANFIKLPEALDYKAHPAEVGVVTDAIATPYKVLRRGRVSPLDTVAIFGAGVGVAIDDV
jgi:propanol-preferring alcohol dehydrogenase